MSISEKPSLPDAPPPIDLARLDVGNGGFAIMESEVNLNVDNLKTGYIKIYRSIQSHWIWEDPLKLSAWIDLLLLARGSPAPQQVAIKGRILNCERGELLRSEETLAERWHWKRSRVHRFLILLRKANMIEIKSEQVTSRISIVNYESYNPLRTDIEQVANSNRTGGEQVANIDNKENKEIKKEGNKESYAREEARIAAKEDFANQSKLVQYLLNWEDIKDPVHLEAVAKVAYPGVDLLAEAVKARAWEVANPKKSKKDHARFLNNWWTRAQDHPRPVQQSSERPINWREQQIKDGTYDPYKDLDPKTGCTRCTP